MNTISLIGRLTRDPDHRVSPNGTDICKLRVAVPRRKTNGEEQPPIYVTVVAFGAQARTANEYLAKGRQVGITGRLDYSEWTADDGSKRSTHEVVAEDVQFLERLRAEAPPTDGQPSEEPF
jgi:single-strand DNA-binding protein